MDGSKLDTHACEGHWIGFDIECSGHHIYLPTNKTVSIEQNIFFTAAKWLEGKTVDIPSSKTTSLDKLSLPSVFPPSAPSKTPLASPLHPRSIPHHPHCHLSLSLSLMPSWSSSKLLLGHCLNAVVVRLHATLKKVERVSELPRRIAVSTAQRQVTHHPPDTVEWA